MSDLIINRQIRVFVSFTFCDMQSERVQVIKLTNERPQRFSRIFT